MIMGMEWSYTQASKPSTPISISSMFFIKKQHKYANTWLYRYVEGLVTFEKDFSLNIINLSHIDPSLLICKKTAGQMKGGPLVFIQDHKTPALCVTLGTLPITRLDVWAGIFCYLSSTHHLIAAYLTSTFLMAHHSWCWRTWFDLLLAFNCLLCLMHTPWTVAYIILYLPVNFI